MRHLVVHSYFCPDASHRPGGVQQIIGPLLTLLRDEFAWSIQVVHSGPCTSTSRHAVIPSCIDPSQPDATEPDLLAAAARMFTAVSRNADVVLSIDRALPARIGVPSVLMSNTLGYQTELCAVSAGCWNRIITPTNHFKSRLRALDRVVKIAVVPYGLSHETRSKLRSLGPPPLDALWVVRIPHRPDRRKGHATAIEGLGRSVSKSRNALLEIAWLDEERYAGFRSELERFARTQGVTEQIVFRPWDDDEQRWECIGRSCATLQLGTFEETFGLACLESALAGRPVLTCRQPAIREVIGASGLHVELSEPLEWLPRLDHVLRNPKPVTLRNARVRPWDNGFTQERMAARYDTVLRAAMQSA